MFSTSMNDFKIEKVLGKGSFGSVYLVTRKEDQKIYALKSVIMDKLNKKEQENSVNEVRILASVNHPNVIGYKEAFWDDQNNTLNIVMEYADEGDLQTKIQNMKKNGGFFDEQLIWSYSIQMIEGLKALHDKKIMHRDLKSANIFLVKNKKQCKIGDMNVSKVIKEKVLRTQTGTPYYASPEVWNDKPYSYKSDLWSIGCVIYELCALRPPFKGKDLDELYINVCKGKVERIKNYYSDSLWKMILMLLQVDVNKRVNCDEFLNHPLIVKKIKEMKEKNIDYKDLEDNKSIHDGYLLNTIKFKDLREIKSQLPTRKNYENTNKNDDNNKYYKNNQFFESKSNKSLNYDKKLNDIYNNNYHLQLNNNSLKANNYTSNSINKDETNKNVNDIKRSQNLENNYTDILKIINEKSSINKYNDFLSQIRKQNNNYPKSTITNNSSHLNNKYNLYEHNFHTEFEDVHSGLDRLSFLRNERDKMKLNSNSELGLNYEKIDTEAKIKYNDKILNLQKEKKKILEAQREKEKQSKTIEEEINYYNKILGNISKKLETNEPKYSYLNIINSYNNKNKYDYLSNHNDKEIKNKNEKIEDKYNKIFNNINNHQIIKSEKERHSQTNNSKMNIKQVSSSSRINVDYKANNDNNKNYIIYYNNLKKVKPLLIKKNILFNSTKERSRSKTPSSLNFGKLNSEGIKLMENIDKNFKYGDKINVSSNNIYKGPLNQISTNNISSFELKNYFDNLHNNIISTENTSSGNYIKRVNKRVVTINKKRQKNNYDSNSNIPRSRHISTVPTKRNKKNININNKLNIYDINSISNQYPNYSNNYLNYDFSKYFNSINLTTVNDSEKRRPKNSFNDNSKIPNSNDLGNFLYRYSSNNIKTNNNKKYSVISNNKNNKIKHNESKTSNSFNFIYPNTNKSYSLIQNTKKINVRSNSYRVKSHEKNYINKKRILDYRPDLTEPEVSISNHLKMKNSKILHPKLANLSLFNSDLEMFGISNNGNRNTFLHNIKSNESNNHFASINKSNKLSGRYYLNIQNEPKCPQIFNNYYSINGVSSSNMPIKVINVFNNKYIL